MKFEASLAPREPHYDMHDVVDYIHVLSHDLKTIPTEQPSECCVHANNDQCRLWSKQRKYFRKDKLAVTKKAKTVIGGALQIER